MKQLPKYLFSILLLFLLVINLSSCENKKVENPDPKSTFTLEFQKEASGKSFEKYDTITNDNGQKYNVSVLRYFISNVRLVKQDNSEITLKDINLVDYFLDPATTNNNVNTNFTYQIPAGNYKGLRFGLGVPEDLNGIKNNNHNPGQYPADHPLSNTYSMSWPMTSTGSYIFMKMEGKFKGGSYAYHTGFDSLYRQVELNKDFSVAAGATQNFVVSLDVNNIFYNTYDPLDITDSKEGFTHSTGTAGFALAKRFTENFIKDLKAK